MADFVVRNWLAAHLGREPDQLDIAGAVRAVGRGQEACYDIDGGDVATVLITWTVAGARGRSSRTVIATLPTGGALDVIAGDDRIVW